MTRGQNIVSNLQSVYSANNSAWLVQCRPNELAKRIDDAVDCAIQEVKPPRCELHKHVVTSLNTVCEICDLEKSVDKAVSETKQECAELCLTTHAFTVFEIRQSIKDAILAPPAPPYPFEKPCKCWRLDEPGSKVWRHDLPEPSNYVLLPIYDNNCRYCGARRKG
jgi:hypothetical protein